MTSCSIKTKSKISFFYYYKFLRLAGVAVKIEIILEGTLNTAG